MFEHLEQEQQQQHILVLASLFHYGTTDTGWPGYANADWPVEFLNQWDRGSHCHHYSHWLYYKVITVKKKKSIKKSINTSIYRNISLMIPYQYSTKLYQFFNYQLTYTWPWRWFILFFFYFYFWFYFFSGDNKCRSLFSYFCNLMLHVTALCFCSDSFSIYPHPL